MSDRFQARPHEQRWFKGWVVVDTQFDDGFSLNVLYIDDQIFHNINNAEGLAKSLAEDLTTYIERLTDKDD